MVIYMNKLKTVIKESAYQTAVINSNVLVTLGMANRRKNE